jgi:hypothetical protein
VGMAGADRSAVFEGGAAVGRPGHFPDARPTPHAFDTQAGADLAAS